MATVTNDGAVIVTTDAVPAGAVYKDGIALTNTGAMYTVNVATTPVAGSFTALTATSLDGVTIDTATNKPVTAASLAGGTLPASVTTLSASGNVGIGTTGPATNLDVAGLIRAGGYTVATLPVGVVGALCYVTDQLTTAAAKGVAPTGGGAVVCYVIYNGIAWVGI